MICFATCCAYRDKLNAVVRPGLSASLSEAYVFDVIPSRGDVFAAYAQAMTTAREETGLECLVLMHDDLEFKDPQLAAKLREAFADPDVAIVGLIGSRSASGITWWAGERAGRVTDDYAGLHDFGFERPDVDKLDGMMLALSPWAVHHLTLDGLGYGGLHGYADELCAQAIEVGKKVRVVDIAAHHHSKGGYAGGKDAFDRAEAHYRERWDLVHRIQALGTDSLAHFGGGYTHEGGYCLQQNPRELAALIRHLRGVVKPGASYLEIGSASGGVCRLLADELGFGRIGSIDDGKHPRAALQDSLLPERAERFRGDSHSPEAAAFVAKGAPWDVAFIDGDHSHEGVAQDIAMVTPHMAPGGIVILHDTVACPEVRRAWEDSVKAGRLRTVKEFRGKERPLGIGVSVALPRAWDALLRPPPWDVEAMYRQHRGGAPVSDTPRVFFAVPNYREQYDIARICNRARDAVVEDLGAHGVEVVMGEASGDSLVQRMRQRITHAFLKSSCTHLLWCDLDIEPLDPACARKMLESGHDIVAGACPFKKLGGSVVFNPLPGSLDGESVELVNGCIEVLDVGTGFQLVSRRAMVQLCEAYPELLHWSRSDQDRDEPLWALYDTGVVDGCYQSEDFMMCRRWQALGGKVYVHVASTFRHFGTHGFEGSLAEQLGLVRA